jgi:muconate/chloromuconate cycloisomerase
MRIRGIETIEVTLPYKRKHILSTGALQGAHSLFVRVNTDAGVEGIGEASMPGGPVWSEEFVGSVRAVCRDYLAPAIHGLDPCRPALVGDAMREAVRGNPFARAAVEMACFDIAGQAASVPVAQLLGGRRRESVPMVWSLAAGAADADIEEAERMHERLGITRFKIKVGHADPAVDLARVTAIAARLADRFELRLDANQAWDRGTAMRLIPRFAELGISVLEQPLPRRDLAGMARLVNMGALPIMADESAMDAHDVAEIIRQGAADLIALKLAKAGGILPTLQSALVAHAAHVPYYMGCMMDTGVGTAAYLQTAALLPDMRHGAALPGPLLLADDLIEEPLVYANGHIQIPMAPGLGVRLDRDALARYAVA